MTGYFLGVDGGQSSTTALIADEYGRVLGMGRSGPCNHVAADEARRKFIAVVGACVEQAAQRAGLGSSGMEFTAACLGFSGGAEDKAALSREIIHSPLIKVTHDAEIALAGAMEGAPGIVIIAGTGSIAFGRNAQGRTARAGGWGYIFGDEGGAFDIARRALRAALRFEEGWGPSTALREGLLAATGAGSANELLHRFYGSVARNTIAGLAPLVDKAAETGDDVAQAILAEAAGQLAWYVKGLHANLFETGSAVPVATIGGVFGSSRLRAAFAGQVRASLQCAVIYPKLSPAAGALLEALRLAGNPSNLSGILETKT